MQLLLIFMCLISTLFTFGQNWTQLTDFPNGARDDGCVFTLNGKAYCGTGRNSGFQVTSDFYSFDLTLEQWSSIASLPDSSGRQYATAQSYIDNGYIFGGIDAQGNYLNDLWKYDPFLDDWTLIGEAPFLGRSGMQSFVIDEKFFVVGGRTANSVATNEAWSYDFTLDVWEQVDSMPNAGVWRGFGVQYMGTGIVGLGSDSTNLKNGKIYTYNSQLSGWSEMPVWETDPITYPVVSVIGDRLYVYGGEDTNGVFINDFRFLDLVNGNWETSNSFPQNARRGSMAFSSTTDFYFSTGLTSTERVKETWVARNVTGIHDVVAVNLTMYLNEGVLTLPQNFEFCNLYSASGERIMLKSIVPGMFRLPTTLVPGVYFCTAYENGSILKGKFFFNGF